MIPAQAASADRAPSTVAVHSTSAVYSSVVMVRSAAASKTASIVGPRVCPLGAYRHSRARG